MTQVRQVKPTGRSRLLAVSGVRSLLALAIITLGLSAFTLLGTVTTAFAANTTAIATYRLYNPNSGEHFYTQSSEERSHLISVGWNDEGIGWYAPSNGNPVYRLYNPNAGDHHYTLSTTERDYLKNVGWIYEGRGWYSDTAKSVPVYRQYNPNAIAGAHNFTTSKAENDYLASVGWNAEGIGWYGVKVNVTVKVIGPSEQSFYVPWTTSADGQTVTVSSGTALEATKQTGLTSDGATFTYTYTTYDSSWNPIEQKLTKGTTNNSRWKLYSKTSSTGTYALTSTSAALTSNEELLWYYDDGKPFAGTAKVTIVGSNGETYLNTTGKVSFAESGWSLLSTVCRASNVTIQASSSSYGMYVTGFSKPNDSTILSGTKTNYWSLLVNGEYSNYGISYVYPRSGDTIEFSYV